MKSHLSLVVDNSSSSSTQWKKVIDHGWNDYSDCFFIKCRNANNEVAYFRFEEETEMWETLDDIRASIVRAQFAIANIKLAVSNPPTWLDLAKARVAKGISATKKHRSNEHRQVMRTLDR
jgi:hypothetical protein